jgi:hypothetical protein
MSENIHDREYESATASATQASIAKTSYFTV